MPNILKIKPSVQNYHWGKIGQDSLIARLIKDYDPKLPYAELWFGAHPKSPSEIDGSLDKLDKFINTNSIEILGERVARKFGNKLPFLFKVLSVNQALSIQAHPDKTLAAKLHSKDPENYPDDNHKPEMAIALTEFWLLSGFRDFAEIMQIFKDYPTITTAFEQIVLSNFLASDLATAPSNFKKLYASLLKSDREKIEQATTALIANIGPNSKNMREQFLVDFYKIYGASDIGIISSLFMNLVCLNPGEATAIGPNIPHAYLKGDIIECMANSDNVVRAGLTPKFQDRTTLTSMLSYELSPFKAVNVKKSVRENWNAYQTNFTEFYIESAQGQINDTFATNDSINLIFCLNGNCTIEQESSRQKLTSGEALIIPAGLLKYRIASTDATLFRVSVPS